MTSEEIKAIYEKFAQNNGYEIIEIEKDHVHALIKTHSDRYGLFEMREGGCIKFIHSWSELPPARMAFKCFCHEEPEEIGKMWENNRQIALYSDEARRKDELISELMDRSGAL